MRCGRETAPGEGFSFQRQEANTPTLRNVDAFGRCPRMAAGLAGGGVSTSCHLDCGDDFAHGEKEVDKSRVLVSPEFDCYLLD